MAENKTVETDASVTDFLDAIENRTRREDGYAVLDLLREATGLEPRMWGPSIIGFGRCHYRYDSGREGDMPRIGFRPRKTSLVFYLSFNEETDRLLARLGKHKMSISCLYINKLADVDAAVLAELIASSWRSATETYGPP